MPLGTYEQHLAPFDRIEHFDRAKEDAAAALLRKHGWHRTSTGHPARAYWLWMREIDGVTYLCSTDVALIIARRDAETQVDPAEFSD